MKVLSFLKKIQNQISVSFDSVTKCGLLPCRMTEGILFPMYTVFILLILITGCSKKSEIPTLKFTTSMSTNYTPVIFTSVEEKIADKYGVHPNVEFAENLEPLLAGKVDAKLNGLAPSLITGANGSDIVIFVGTMGGGHFIFANKKVAAELKDPKNWKGHIVGIRPQVTSQLVLNSVLKEKYGYNSDEVVFKYFDNDMAGITACVKGEVDITSVYYSFRDTALSQGLVPIGELVDISPDYACCRQTARGEIFRSNRDLFVKWTKSLIESWKIFNTNPQVALNVVKKITKQDEDWAYEHIYDADATAHITFNPDPFYNGCLAQYDICIEMKYVNENYRPLYEFFDISVYADALKEIIKENPGDQFYKDMWTYFLSHNDKYPGFAEKYTKEL